jgi:hypothetical protein
MDQWKDFPQDEAAERFATNCVKLTTVLLVGVLHVLFSQAHPIEGTLAGLNSRLNLDRHAR